MHWTPEYCISVQHHQLIKKLQAQIVPYISKALSILTAFKEGKYLSSKCTYVVMQEILALQNFTHYPAFQQYCIFLVRTCSLNLILTEKHLILTNFEGVYINTCTYGYYCAIFFPFKIHVIKIQVKLFLFCYETSLYLAKQKKEWGKQAVIRYQTISLT